MRKANPIKFGTDGWRAVVARDYTFDNVALCAQGVAQYLLAEGRTRGGLMVGYDTRYASSDFAAEVAQVLAGNGIVAHLCDRASPTPVVSYNILARKTEGAAIITASHNPWQWNGFKYKPEYAGSATPEVTARLEQEIERAAIQGVKRLPLEEARKRGLALDVDPTGPYLENLARLVDFSALRGAGLHIVADAMWGAGAGYFSAVLSGGATRIIEIHAERNPLFPDMANPEPIAHNLKTLSSRIRRSRADVGLALDGDADRFGLVDERGEYITTLQTFSLLCLYLLEVRQQRGPLVRSITMSGMVNKLGERFGVPVFETPVGFKFLGPVMMRENALAAGEESGGYAFRGNIPERDGVISGLMFLDMMVKTGKRPSELLAHLFDVVGPHFYDRWDVHFQPEKRKAVQQRLASARPDSLAGKRVERIDTQDGYRYLLAGGHWCLVRFSGTEPLVRMYAEAESADAVKGLLESVRDLAGL